MKKICVVLLVMLFAANAGVASPETIKTSINTGVSSVVNKDVKPGILNKISFPRGASSFTFTADILGTGDEQTIKISKNGYVNYNIKVYRQNEILTSMNFIGPVSGDTFIPNEQWYLAYLRPNHAPDIVYSLVEGSGIYLNSLKIFGITKGNEINKLFDADPYLIPEKIGGQTQLSMDGLKLILAGQKGKVAIDLGNNQVERGL